MRLFVGIDLTAEVKRSLSALIGALRPTARLKWSPVENLHITTKFIGDWPEARLGELTAALRNLPPRRPIHIAIQGLGWFPNPRAPRVFWTGMEADAGLAELARETDTALARVGVAAEKRAFSPHLTLARIGDPVPLVHLLGAISALPSDQFGEFTADRFYLYLSELRPAGSVYTKLEEFSFAQS